MIRLLINLCCYPFVLLRCRSWWKLRQLALRSGGVVRWAYLHFTARSGASIPLETEMPYQPCFPHGRNGVFVSRGAKIGKDVVIFQQVTIGSNTLKDSGGSAGLAPEIGDNVYIGAGAKIIGGVKVGDHCRIGANCCVYKDLPPHSVAVMAPMRLIQKESLDNRFFSKESGGEMFWEDGQWKRG